MNESDNIKIHFIFIQKIKIIKRLEKIENHIEFTNHFGFC